MLDLRLIRSEPEGVREALRRRGEAQAVDDLLALDARRRELLPQLEELRATKNRASERIGELKRAGSQAEEAIAEMRTVAEREKELKGEDDALERRLEAALAALPNLPEASAPPED